MISSYWKSANFGDKKLAGFFDNSPLVLEEKYDGSQISFGVISGKLYVRSRNKILDPSNPEKLFAKSVDHILSIQDKLPEDVVFRGEAITSSRHNALTYSSAPPGYVVVFNADYLDGTSEFGFEIEDMVKMLGMHPVRTLDVFPEPVSVEEVYEKMSEYSEMESDLGGTKMEGVVAKRMGTPLFYYDRPLFCKLVRQEFKELNKKVWGETNPTKSDVISLAVDSICTEARFNKAVQHLKESGNYKGEHADIGPLIKLLHQDIEEEDQEEIKERMWKWALPHIKRMAGARIPKWYKEKLAAEFISGGERDS